MTTPLPNTPAKRVSIHPRGRIPWRTHPRRVNYFRAKDKNSVPSADGKNCDVDLIEPTRPAATSLDNYVFDELQCQPGADNYQLLLARASTGNDFLAQQAKIVTKNPRSNNMKTEHIPAQILATES